jgi:hypothetical protein
MQRQAERLTTKAAARKMVMGRRCGRPTSTAIRSGIVHLKEVRLDCDRGGIGIALNGSRAGPSGRSRLRFRSARSAPLANRSNHRLENRKDSMRGVIVTATVPGQSGMLSVRPTACARTSDGMRCTNWGMDDPDRFTGRTSLKSIDAHPCSTLGSAQRSDEA